MTKSEKRFYIITFGIMMLIGFYLSIYQSIISEISGMFGTGGALTGILIALYFTGAFLSPIVCGELGDRIGKKPVLLAGFVVLTTGVIIVALSKHILVTCAGVFLMGGGGCTIEGLLSAKITDENPHAAERFMNYSQVFFCLGAVLGPMIRLAVKSLGGQWQMNMYIIAVLLIIAGCIFLTIPNDKKKPIEKAASSKAYSLTLLKDVRFLLFFVSMFLYVGAEAGLAFFVVDYFGEAQAASYGEISLSLFWAGMIAGRLVAGVLYRYSGKLMVIYLAIALLFSLMLQLNSPPVASVVMIFMTGLGFSAVWPLLMANCTRAYSNTSGTAGGLMVAGGSFGGILMPMIMGFLAAGGSVKNAIIVVSVMMLITLIINLHMWRKKQPDNATTQ